MTAARKSPRRTPSIARPPAAAGVDPLAGLDLDLDLDQDDAVVDAVHPVVVGLYAAAQPCRCAWCPTIVPAGHRRPHVAPGRPLCASCVVEAGAGDVEGVLDALEVLEGWPQLTSSHHGRRLLHAARQWAEARLTTLVDDLDRAGRR